ncbi:MAG: tetratricopeptide repeat protein, partial [Cyanobacteria bacterium J06636_16]
MRRIHRLLLLTIAGFLLSLSAPALSQQPVQGPALTQAQPSSAIDGVTVAPDAAGFQIIFPASPTEQRPTEDLTLHLLEQTDTTFGVAYQQFPPAISQLPPDQVQAILAEASSVFTNGETILSDRPLTLANHPGRELTFTTTDGTAGIVRAYLVDNTLYLLLVTAPDATTLPTTAAPFLDSFALIDTGTQTATTPDPDTTAIDTTAADAYQQGVQAYQAGDLTSAVASFESATTAAQSAGDRHREAQALFGLGSAYNNLGQYAEAQTAYEQSLELFRALD